MKRKFLGIVMIAVIAAAAGWNVYQNENKVLLSELGLANIEALARGEGDGAYNEDKVTSNYYENGVLYKQSIVVDCSEGGSSACSAGKYYRHINSDRSWGDWIPA
ncbi:hypothetical protein M2480_002791 [Parabacteroides sp. PFB2-12]|uniref:NVEALA domain-containing protein n=1 Tax=unclassified Parabacteroides TaxID=2649774 RepID=UPI002475A61E|nr:MULTISPECIES: NVEALA domain-containing protein [unclassified Parabacteroides]MDH6344306.1 hypothetical protein [Parabacteroides sp. PM6-13]MDH6391789.1 hypothetical protein [Parabacteroides sp. PFB2-12]